MQFEEVQDGSVVLREKGAYRPAKVYTLGNRLFGEYRKGTYVALHMQEQTSMPKVTWNHLSTPFSTGHKDGRIIKEPA